MAAEDASRREELKRRCFRSCDADGDGFLKRAEMRTFAGYVGFGGTEEEWNEEYRKICAETDSNPAAGVPMAVVLRLLDDKSDFGCYCTSEEMMDILGLDGAELAHGAPGVDDPPMAEPEDAIALREQRGEGRRRIADAPGATDVPMASPEDAPALRERRGEGRRRTAEVPGTDDASTSGSEDTKPGREEGRASTVRIGEALGDGGSAVGSSSGLGPRIGGRARGRGGGGGRAAASWGRAHMSDGGSGGLRVYDDQEATSHEGCTDARADDHGGAAGSSWGGRTAGRFAGSSGDGRTVFFGGVPFETDGDHLLSKFRTAGNVEALWVFTRADGRSRGMGLVRYQTAQEAHAAVKTLSGATVDGREMVVIIDSTGAMDGPESANSAMGERERRRVVLRGSQVYRRSGLGGEAASCESGRLFFAGASFETDEAMLRAHFEEYGPVESVKLFRLRDGRSRGMGISAFASPDSASRALWGGVEVDGRALFLQEDNSRGVWTTSAELAWSPRQARWPNGDAVDYSQPARAWRGRGAGHAQRYSPYDEAASSPPGSVDPSKSVFFRNAPFETDAAALLEHFEEVGRVRSFRLFTNPDGSSRGMGVIQYINPVSAARAYYNLHGLSLEGRPLVVTEYCP